MGLFGAAHGWGQGQKAPPLNAKICHTYSAMMKLGTVIPKEDSKYVAHDLGSLHISIFL